ncbi:MAG: TIGR02253 family HAD-type hydrolase [Candidatus Micrarchaeota archaeon]
MRIRAIFFDIDDTLFPSTRFAELARRNAINAMVEAGLDVDPELAYRRLLAVIKKYGSNYERHFDILLKELRAGRSPKLTAAGVAAYHNTKSTILPFPEVPRTLLSLRERGYELYVASEGNSVKQWDKLIRLGLHNIFHDVFVSEDIGESKSKKFFEKILARLRLDPRSTIMVGDKIEKDMIPARSAGMLTVRITRDQFAASRKWSIFAKQKLERNGKGPADFEIKKMDELLRVLEKIEKME